MCSITFFGPPTTSNSALSLHDALPIFGSVSSSSIALLNQSSSAAIGAGVSSLSMTRNSPPSMLTSSPSRYWPSSRSEEHTSELQSLRQLVCHLLPAENIQNIIMMNLIG